MLNNNCKISIIVPAYNVERYIGRLIESVQEQLFQDFELLLVDDGSIDKTGIICDDYAKKYSNIKVIHQKNSGAHESRNNALKVANGEYVFFFDGDDYIDANYFTEIYDLAKKYDANLVISGFYIDTYYDETNYITFNYKPIIESQAGIDFYKEKDEFQKLAYKNFDQNMFYPPWNKLYKLSYLKEHNISFPHTYRDDFPFVISVIKDIDKVVYTQKQYYHFIRKRSDSETQKFVSSLFDKREEEHKMMMDLYSYWNLINDNPSMEMIARRYIDRIIECIVNLFNKECTLNKCEIKNNISKFVNTKTFDNCIKIAKPKKLYLKIMYIPLRIKSISLLYTMGNFINYVKSKNIKIFAKLKTNR